MRRGVCGDVRIELVGDVVWYCVCDGDGRLLCCLGCSDRVCRGWIYIKGSVEVMRRGDVCA